MLLGTGIYDLNKLKYIGAALHFHINCTANEKLFAGTFHYPAGKF